MFRELLLIFCLFISFNLIGQEIVKNKNPLLIESSTYFGTPIKHSPKITFSTARFSFAQDLNINWQTVGNKKWQEKHKYPRIGIHMLAVNLGEKDTLGQAISIAPNISFPIHNNDFWEARFQLSYGLALLNKVYDEATNPLNNSISSNLNVSAVFKLENQIRLHPKWWLKAGVNLIHFSNGAGSIPNLGMNILTGNIGLSYRPEILANVSKLKDGRIKYKQNRWGADLQAGVGFRERQAAFGPRYPIYSASAALLYRATAVHHLRIGFEYEYNRSAFIFGKHIWIFDDDKVGRRGAERYHLFYAHEFRFGSFGIYLYLALNVNSKSLVVSSNISNKYSLRYYFPAISKPATTFYTSFNLKSNVTIAEYLSISMGATF